MIVRVVSNRMGSEVNKMKIFLTLVCVAAVLGLGYYGKAYISKTDSQNSTNQQPQKQTDLVTYLNDNGAKTMASAIKNSGFDQRFKQGGPYTLFVPSDTALQLPENSSSLNTLNTSQGASSFLQNYVVQGTITSDNLTSSDFKTFAGTPLAFTQDGADHFVNGKKMLSYAQVGNNVVYVIDGTFTLPTTTDGSGSTSSNSSSNSSLYNNGTGSSSSLLNGTTGGSNTSMLNSLLGQNGQGANNSALGSGTGTNSIGQNSNGMTGSSSSSMMNGLLGGSNGLGGTSSSGIGGMGATGNSSTTGLNTNGVGSGSVNGSILNNGGASSSTGGTGDLLGNISSGSF